jgi:hypothetical protein
MMSVILKSLAILLMLLFLLKAEISLIKKERDLSSLAIVMNQKAFNSSILEMISYFFPEMLFF